MEYFIGIAIILVAIYFIFTLINKRKIRELLNSAIEKNQKIRISYKNKNGTSTTRILSNIQMSNEYQDFGYNNQHIKAYCHLRKEERSFKIGRIKKIEILN